MKKLLSLTAVALLSTAPAHAAFVTSLTGGTAITMPTANLFTAGPQTFGPLTFASDYSNSVFGWTNGYGFNPNGNWGNEAPMAGLNRGSDGGGYSSMTFTFDTPTAGVLAQMNWALGYSNNNSVIMQIFDANGVELESYVTLANNGNVNTLTPNGYYGFQRATADIKTFKLSNGYIGARNFSYIAANGGVPEPASWALMLAGFGLAGTALRRRTTGVAHAA